MTLYEVVNSITEIAKNQPTVRTVGEGSIYTFLNGSPNTKYCVVFLQQTTHRQTEDYDYYGFNIFFIDRLSDANGVDNNRLQIQSIGKEVLRNIIKTFCAENDCDFYSEIRYYPFTEKFVDTTAGVYASLEFEIPIDYTCEEEY